MTITVETMSKFMPSQHLGFRRSALLREAGRVDFPVAQTE